MKKKSMRAALLLIAFCLLLSPFPASAVDSTPHSWYCPRTQNGERPRLDHEFSFIGSHRCVFCNEACSEDDRVIYLTFDAGYINENVVSILDTLDAHRAKGAFFILDHVIDSEPDLVRRMAQSGHLVGNHTMHHHDMTKCGDEETFAAELRGLAAHYRTCTGQEMPLFYRPPEGRISDRELAFADALGYTTVLWSFAYADWDNAKQPDPEASLQKILRGTHNGEILLLHPTSATNAAILDDLLTAWEEQGYRFGSLDELAK